DYVLTSQNGWDVFPSGAADAGRSVRGVEFVSHVRGDRGRVGRANAGINGVDPATIEKVVSVKVDGAQLASLTGNEAVVKDRFAKANGIRVGDTFTFRGPNGRATELKAVGLFKAPKLDSLLSAIVISNATFDQTLPRPHDQYAFVTVRDGVSSAATAALEAAYSHDQIAKVETRAGFAASKS